MDLRQRNCTQTEPSAADAHHQLTLCTLLHCPLQVQGGNSHLYFKRPLLAVDEMAPPVQYAPHTTGATPVTTQQYMQYDDSDQPATKTVGTQSDYRESEAQTLPWSPDYVIPADGARAEKQARIDAAAGREGPELLQLADLQ